MLRKVRLATGSLLASLVLVAGAVGVAAATIEHPPEGGTWNYGVGASTYSNYVNSTPQHATTAVGRNFVRSKCASANSWAYASSESAAWGNKAYYRNTCP